MRRRGVEAPSDSPAQGRERFDKWLWAARIYRTRSLAALAIDAGHARVDGERVKPAQLVQPGTRVDVRKKELTWHLDVLALAPRRGSATEAATMYRETPASIQARESFIAERKAVKDGTPRTPGRPTKRDRRRLEDFLAEP